jgi:hypothetical protein
MSLMREVRVVVLEEEGRLFRVGGARDGDAFWQRCDRTRVGQAAAGSGDRAAVIHMAMSMFDAPAVARNLAVQGSKRGSRLATIHLQPGLEICVAKTGGPAHWLVWAGRRSWSNAPPMLWPLPICAHSENTPQTMTYSIFDGSGKPHRRVHGPRRCPRLPRRHRSGRAGGGRRSLLIAQGEAGEAVGETVFAASDCATRSVGISAAEASSRRSRERA